ncbi:MAG TPA: hypothetical protein VF174_08065 [Micromonosporaceae bacterium]|nr:hypothetical protein [Nocardiopsaceae bacterium]
MTVTDPLATEVLTTVGRHGLEQRRNAESHTRHPWVPEPCDRSERPTKEGKDA